MKVHLIPAIASLLVLSTSCSWYRSLERSLVEEDKKTAEQNRRKPVPREQYDQLLVKYEELSKKYEALKEGRPSPDSSLVDELRSANVSPNVETETVNIFPPIGQQSASSTGYVPQDLESELALYRRAVTLKANNPGEATKLFQQLESNGSPSVKVRARFQIGEMLYSKQQYDLALQVFEDIITREAHSGVVLDALKLAAASSEKLGLTPKRDQYTSMLRDVFEVR